jgi:hypothetical protein
MEEAPSLFDDSKPEDRVGFGIARAEVAARGAALAMAEQLAAIGDTVAEAVAFPHVFLGSGCGTGREAVEFARRAAIAELATGLGLAESVVAAQAAEAETMRTRLPRLWALFRAGEISYQNARIIAEQAALLPEDAEVLTVFDDTLAPLAGTLTAAKLRVRARSLREKLHDESLTDRHRRAMADRRVYLEAAPDGMAWLSGLLPADVAHRAFAGIDANARHLFAQPDEQRTLAQLRADVAGQILTGDGTASEVGATVSITVPVLTAMGESDEPGFLDGYGPIDADTARRMAAKAPSFHRILTHPVTSAILDVDRTSYRVPADMRRWLAARDGGCVFPGCNRRPENCDIDHTTAWQHGGTTEAGNLAHLCRHHHRLKHKTRWNLDRDSNRRLSWTTPTGAIRTTDPPPF